MKKLNTKNIISNLLLGIGVIFVLCGLFTGSVIFLAVGFIIWMAGLGATRQ